MMKYWWALGLIFVWGREVVAAEPPKGMVRTFQGLLQLEQDAQVTDEAKVQAWQLFIQRTQEQLAYARKAASHWKDADRIRWLEAAREADQEPSLTPRQRVAQWQLIVTKYPRSEAVSEARSRIHYWRSVETQRLVQAAELVESSGRSKVDRIQAWKSVQLWAPESREAKAATRRISALQNQLVKEAESLEHIDRIDIQTKLDAWEDVLRGHPTEAQTSLGKRKIAQLRTQSSRP